MILLLSEVHHCLRSVFSARTPLSSTRLFCYNIRPWTAASAQVESIRMIQRQCKMLPCRNVSSFHHQLHRPVNHVMIGPQNGVSSITNHCRFIHTSVERLSSEQSQNSGTAAVKEVSLGTKILRTIGWLGGFYSKKSVLIRSAKVMYESCIDSIEYEQFFKVFSLPDTFQSWFLVAHLHVWLCMVRMKREGKNGDTIIRELVANFWEDVEQRIRELGVHSGSVRSKSLKELSQEFYGLTFAYEEGLLSNDKILAAAIWRNFIHDKANTDPSQLVTMVDYIRRQVQHMDQLNSEQLLQVGRVTLLPLIQHV